MIDSTLAPSSDTPPFPYLVKLFRAPYFTELSLFFGALFLFTFHLAEFGSCHGLGLEGSRFVLFAQEMLQHGFTPFPTVYGHFYPDYPVTHTLIVYLLSLITGKVTTLLVVLPTAVASSVTILLTYRLGAIYSRIWGLTAVLFELITFEFFILARAPSLDQIVAAATIFCFYHAYIGKIRQTSGQLKWFTIGLIIGFLFRGAIGLVIPASVIGIFYLMNKDYKRMLHSAMLSIGLLALCTFTLFAIAYQTAGADFAKSVWQMEIFGRIDRVVDHANFYYYFIYGFTNYAPSFLVALCVLTFLGKQIFSTNDIKDPLYLLKMSAAWLFIIFVGLSIPLDKHPRYIVAITPALALIASFPLTNLLRAPTIQKTQAWILRTSSIFPWLLCSLSLLGLIFNHATLSIFDAHFFTGFLCGLLILIGGHFIHEFYKKNETSEQFLIHFIQGSIAVIILYMTILVPIAEQFNSLRPLANVIAPKLTHNTQIIFYNIGPDGETDDIKLMAQLNFAKNPSFYYQPLQLQQLKSPLILITQQPYFDNLPLSLKQTFTVLFSGTVDRETWVILMK